MSHGEKRLTTREAETLLLLAAQNAATEGKSFGMAVRELLPIPASESTCIDSSDDPTTVKQWLFSNWVEDEL